MPDHHCWECRELDRFYNGHYQRVPWHDADWTYKPETDRHFVHVSRHDPQLVAYTASPEHGEQDRQIRVSPGKYLSRFYGDVLTQKDIQYWCGRFKAENGPAELKFATTADEIVRVYRSGPESCMSHSADAYSSAPMHPVEVYAAGDLAVAYVGQGDKISARCICWPEKKVYGRIYGDAALLEGKLAANGFTYGGFAAAFLGARLHKIEEGAGFVCPYLDVAGYVQVDGDYLRISTDGFDARETDGTTAGGCCCPHCEDVYSSGRSIWIAAVEEYWCPGCADEYTSFCEICEERCPDEDMHRVGDELVCEGCLDQYCTYCEPCEEYHRGEPCEPEEDETVPTVPDERQVELVLF